jgi:hypothetical protein
MNEHRETEEATATIRNRDIPILAEVLSIMQLVNKTEEMRDWQRDRAVHITANLSGMPRGGGMTGLDEAVAALDELDRQQAQECREYAQHLRRAQRILNGIESRTMRAFVMMKYVMDMRDADIRRELNMTRWGFDRARRSVEDAPDMAAVKWQERYILEQKS